MRLLTATEQRFACGPDRHVYVDGPAKYSAWANYLEAFDEVVVLARVATAGHVGAESARVAATRDVDAERARAANATRAGEPPRVAADARACREEARADGPSVSFFALPDYRGPWEYLRRLSQLKARVREAVESCDAYILRVPGLVGRLVWHELRRCGKPYALEVVGDPWDALGPGTWRSAMRPVFRRVAARDLKEMCRGAMAVHYVTQSSLQRRYPPAKNAYAVGFSDALMDSAFASAAEMNERFRRIDDVAGTNSARRAFRAGFVGSLAQMYKGPDVLLRAASVCRARGLNIETALAGDGRYAAAMKALAKQLGIEERTRFLGQLAFGKAVFDFLDSVDLFVMPSYAEGLPRALLEAMARGCPCVGSDVGGIPELLDAAEMAPAGDAKALAEKIMEVAASGARLKEMAARNLEKARRFSPELLREVRGEFCRFVRGHSGETLEPQMIPKLRDR
jgi:glycosyltransferase involved in cell wall biosynthesis